MNQTQGTFDVISSQRKINLRKEKKNEECVCVRV